MGLLKSKLIMMVPLIPNFCRIIGDEKMFNVHTSSTALSILLKLVSTCLCNSPSCVNLPFQVHRVPGPQSLCHGPSARKPPRVFLYYPAESINMHCSIHHISNYSRLCRSGPLMRLSQGQVQELILFLSSNSQHLV